MPLVGGSDEDDDTSELGMMAKVALVFTVLGLGWVALQTGVLQALVALGVASPMTAGLLVLVVFAYWAIDSLEEDDDATDVIKKTSGRAENATKGLLDGSAALILGGGAVAGTIGLQVFDGLVGFIDVALQAPAFGLTQLATIVAGVLGAVGVLSPMMVVVAGIGLLVVGAIARRRRQMEG